MVLIGGHIDDIIPHKIANCSGPKVRHAAISKYILPTRARSTHSQIRKTTIELEVCERRL
jgi:hypothetical protein